jgi:hypothetical protein
MNPNEMTDPRVVKAENKLESQASASAKKGAYRRLVENPDFNIFYNYLETCYNSYIESGGEAQTPKDIKDHVLAEAATIHKILAYVKRQAK